MLNSIYLFPHGLQVVPGTEDPYNESFRSLHKILEQIGSTINTDLIILVTPHGHTLENDYVIYGHDIYQGLHYRINEDSVVQGDIFNSYLFKGDSSNAKKFYDLLNSSDISTQYLIQGSPSYPFTLCWGEFVPLYYVPKDIPIIILSLPRKRYEKLDEMQTELQKIGGLINKFSKETDKRVSLIISADLAHTHQENGPYGFHESSEEFDNFVKKWAYNANNENLSKLMKLNKTALACGIAGINIISPLLTDYKINSYFYDCPSYFGMAVISWKKTE